MSRSNRTHLKKSKSLSQAIKNLKQAILNRGDLPHVSIEKQLAIIDDLSSFSLGHFFLERRGANGFWTDYIINFPETKNSENKKLSPVEDFIINRCPLTIATRERFKIFQNCIKKFLKNNMKLASIPCGMMRDLLSINYKKCKAISLMGIDLDSESLKLASDLAKKLKASHITQFLQADAWKLPFHNEFDLITSSGLNVYVSNKKQIINLYKMFHKSLKKEGVLIVGVLTIPPYHSKNSEWNTKGIPKKDILMEKILYYDILDCKWGNFQKTEEIPNDFYLAGFSKVEVIFDKHRIFPTVIAKK